MTYFGRSHHDTARHDMTSDEIRIPTHRTEHIGEHPFDFRLRGAVTRILGDKVEEFAAGGKVHYHVYVSLVLDVLKRVQDVKNIR